MSDVSALLRAEGRVLLASTEGSVVKISWWNQLFASPQLLKIAAVLVVAVAVGAILYWAPWTSRDDLQALFALPIEPPMIPLQTNLSRAQRLRARIDLYKQKKFAEVIRELDQASRIEGEYQQAAFFIGVSSLYIGDFTKAAENLRRALSGPSIGYETQVRWYLAIAEWKLNQRQAAMEELRKITRLNDEFKQKAEEALRKLTER
ncbi:MAG: hypothetical protein HY644_12505 [Acidobacteria bacterium]|nr:hypothetical protein [Acidobacteriota bacterium]